MVNLAKIASTRSKAAENIRDFYLTSESECEDVPFAPYRPTGKLKGSDLYVQMQLLTERVRRPQNTQNNPTNITGFSNPDDTGPGNAQILTGAAITGDEASSSTGPSIAETLHALPKNKPGLNKEDTHQFEEKIKGKQHEPWGKIFSGTGLRLVFKGGAGSGKSFSLSQEVRERLIKARRDLENFNCPLNDLEIPIFVRAGALVSSNAISIADSIIHALPNAGKLTSQALKEWFLHAFQSEQGRRLFIVVDGLDELPESSQRIFRERMRQMDGELRSASLIVTCRTMYFDERRDWISWAGDRRTRIVELAPLEDEQKSRLIEKLIGNEDLSKEKLLGLLKRNYSLSYLCRTPFILTSTCLLYADGWLSEKTTYDSLYKALTEKMLSGDWKELPQRPEWTKRTDVLREAAKQDRIASLSRISWHLFDASPSENRFTLRQWRDAYAKALDKQKTVRSPVLLLDELVGVGMVINAGYDTEHNKCYSFAHRTILEYLAARGMIEQHKETQWVKMLVTHMWCESDWVEIIRFAASYTRNPTYLLRSVAREAGSISRKNRSLPRLSFICRGLGSATVAFLIIFFVISIGVVLSSENFAAETAQYRSFRDPYIENLKASYLSSVSDLTRLWNRSITNFIFALGDEAAKLYPLLKEEFLRFYDFFFQFLYQESSRGGRTENQNRLAALVETMYFYTPALIYSIFALFLTGSIVSWLDRHIFYWVGFVKTDDIFLTGLRIQAEVIGHNEKVSDKEVKRVMNELWRSTEVMHGARAEERIPEDLLLLVGSNFNARRELNKSWIKPIKCRRRRLAILNWLYETGSSWYLRTIYLIRRKEISPLFRARDLKKAGQLGDKLNDSYVYSDQESKNTELLAAYIRGKLSDHTRQRLDEHSFQNSEQSLRTALARDLNVILRDQLLFNRARFGQIELNDELYELAKQKPEGEKLSRLNRLLLEGAFPGEIRKMENIGLRTSIRLYKAISSWYYNSVSPVAKKKVSSFITAKDFRRVRKLCAQLTGKSNDGYGSDTTQLLSTYIFEKFSPVTKILLKGLPHRNRYGKKERPKKSRRFPEEVKIFFKRGRLKRMFGKHREGKIRKALAEDLNVILLESSLFDEERFRRIKLRTETRSLLNNVPAGEELVYSNRLLLEDAYPKIRKIQKIWLRIPCWFPRKLVKNPLFSWMLDLQNIQTASIEFRAFRGLALLPDAQNQGLLIDLLKQSALSTKYLVSEKLTSRTFSLIDIYAAKALAKTGNSMGKERLTEMAGRTGEQNKYTPDAIKELSSIDEKRTIELAAICIKEGWKADSGYDYTFSKEYEFHTVLSALRYETVVEELTRLCVETKDASYFHKVLLPYLRRINDATARDWLQKTVLDNSAQILAAAAKSELKSEFNKYWVDGDAWIEDRIILIEEFLEKNDWESAVEEFDTLVSDYRSSSEGLIKNSERIASLCGKQMLETWFKRYGGNSSAYKNLVLLAGAPSGGALSKFLFRRAVDTEYLGSNWKRKLWLALSETGDNKAEEILLGILNKYNRIDFIIKRKLTFSDFNRQEEKRYLIGALGKIGSDRAVRQITRELNKNSSSEFYYIAARLLAERDDPLALKLLLIGKNKRGSTAKWEDDFGDEPGMREMALQFGARISKVNDGGLEEHIAASQTRNFKYVKNKWRLSTRIKVWNRQKTA